MCFPLCVCSPGFLALYLVVFSSVAPAVTDRDEMTKQHSFTSTPFTPSSPPFFLHRSYSFLLFLDWQGHYFTFLKKCLAGIFTLKEIMGLRTRSEAILSAFFYVKNYVINYVLIFFKIMYLFSLRLCICTFYIFLLSASFRASFPPLWGPLCLLGGQNVLPTLAI